MALHQLFLHLGIIFSVANIVVSVNTMNTSIEDTANHGWDYGHATFYGGTTGGACGYGNTYVDGTTALGDYLFNNGAACGACFEVVCINDPQWCIHGKSINVMVTDRCPGGVCAPPQKHFDLAMSMFQQIAKIEAGIIPIAFRPVKCGRRGGISFKIDGNPYWTDVVPLNVGGVGNVVGMNTKGSSSPKWISMTRNWGENWQTGELLQGQKLSFQVTAGDGSIVNCIDITPKNWQFGKSYGCPYNFK